MSFIHMVKCSQIDNTFAKLWKGRERRNTDKGPVLGKDVCRVSTYFSALKIIQFECHLQSLSGLD